MLTREEEELPICMFLRSAGQDFTMIIDRTKDQRYLVRWEEDGHTFPVTFATLREAEDFAEGWLDMIEAGGEILLERAQESSRPTGKDCMGFVALIGLLATLVLLLYLFG
jgi:hypothetical protein